MTVGESHWPSAGRNDVVIFIEVMEGGWLLSELLVVMYDGLHISCIEPYDSCCLIRWMALA